MRNVRSYNFFINFDLWGDKISVKTLSCFHAPVRCSSFLGTFYGSGKEQNTEDKQFQRGKALILKTTGINEKPHRVSSFSRAT